MRSACSMGGRPPWMKVKDARQFLIAARGRSRTLPSPRTGETAKPGPLSCACCLAQKTNF